MPRNRHSQRKRCGAKTRSGKPCRQWAVTGKERCRLHGGAPDSGRPIAHGAYSEHLHEKAPDLALYVDMVQAEEEAGQGMTLSPEIMLMRGRLRQNATERQDPVGDSALAGAVTRLVRTEQGLERLFPLSNFLEWARDVFDAIDSVLDEDGQRAYKAELARRGLVRK